MGIAMVCLVLILVTETLASCSFQDESVIKEAFDILKNASNPTYQPPASSIRDLLMAQMEVTFSPLKRSRIKHPTGSRTEEPGYFLKFTKNSDGLTANDAKPRAGACHGDIDTKDEF